jgi:hypothetical protein
MDIKDGNFTLLAFSVIVSMKGFQIGWLTSKIVDAVGLPFIGQQDSCWETSEPDH